MEQLTALLKMLFGAFPNSSVTKENLAAYTSALSDVPIDELTIVIHQMIREPLDFVPTPGKILEHWRQAKSPVSPDAAAAGLQSLRKAIAGVGAWGYPKFKDPIVGKVVEAMGWDMICASENWSTDRAHFLRLYESFAKQDGNEQRLTTEYKALRDESQQKQLESNGEN